MKQLSLWTKTGASFAALSPAPATRRAFIAWALALVLYTNGVAGEPSGKPAIWPQWRGPQRDGQVPGNAPWPARIAGDSVKQSWRIPLGPSYSGPIVSETTVFVTETLEKKREVVRALDRATGNQVWEASWPGSLSVPFFAKANGDWIRSTPAYDGECVYVAGMRELLVCLDAAKGNIRWHVDFVKEFGTPLPAFGFVSSPLVEGPHVYVQAGAACVKLDKRSGKVLWRSLKDAGGMMGSPFSSPYLARIAGREQLLVQTREKLAGLDPASGDVLWSKDVPAFRGMNILTPTVSGDSIFTSSYGGKSLLLTAAPRDQSIEIQETWMNKATGYMSSPLLIDGHLYLHLQNQRVTCLNAKTGQTKWTTQPFGKYWSLVGHGDKILALDERGELYLLRANPEKFELLDSRKISEDPAWAHLAVCGDEIFIREQNAMAAYRWRATAP